MNEKERQAAASDLAQIAMRLRRTPKGDQVGLLAAADTCINRYRAASATEYRDEIGAEDHVEEAVAPELVEALPAVRSFLDDYLHPFGFSLFVYSTDDDGQGRINFVTNCPMDGILQTLREFIAAQEVAG